MEVIIVDEGLWFFETILEILILEGWRFFLSLWPTNLSKLFYAKSILYK